MVHWNKAGVIVYVFMVIIVISDDDFKGGPQECSAKFQITPPPTF